MTSRRGYLAVLGTATVLAGCSGTEEVSDPVESPNNTTGENESTNDTSTPNETAGDSPDNDNTSTTNETVEDQPEDDDTESSISFDTAEWLDEGSDGMKAC